MELSALTDYIQLVSGLIIATTSLVAAVVGFVSPIRRWVVQRLNKSVDFNTRVTKIEADVANINNFVTVLKQDLEVKFDNDRKEQALMKEATIASTRNDLTAIYNNAIEKGYIGDYDRENFEKMYKVYSDLGGNSYIHEIHTQVLRMPNAPARKSRRTISRRTSMSGR